MTLEEEVKKLMEDPIEASVPNLEAFTAQRDPNAPLPLPDLIAFMQAQLLGLKRAVLRLAREIDQTRDV
jgi:hypothetical protein